MVEENKLSLWDIVYKIDPNNIGKCASMDELLASKLTDWDQFSSVWYYLNSNDLPPVMPKTKARINQIAQQELKENIANFSWWRLNDFSEWLDDSTEKIIVKEWLANVVQIPSYRISSLCAKQASGEFGTTILARVLSEYKKRKSGYILESVGNIFARIRDEDLDEACELLVNSTPAVSACLLKRDNIPAKYMPKALKSLGKLTRQKKIGVKIDFESLQGLGPRERLNVMQQLLGTYDRYYKLMSYYKAAGQNNSYYYNRYEEYYKKYGVQNEFPFKEIPNKDDVERFLFPCSLKYNKEVNEIMARYNELIASVGQIKEESDGKCI